MFRYLKLTETDSFFHRMDCDTNAVLTGIEGLVKSSLSYVLYNLQIAVYNSQEQQFILSDIRWAFQSGKV